MTDNMPARKSIRLRDFDYSQAGYYFLTVCVKDRQCILGHVVGNTPHAAHDSTIPRPVGDGVLDVPCVPSTPNVPDDPGIPHTQLSEYGKIVNDCIADISDFYDHVAIEKYVIMPNHLHMIVVVKDGTSRTPSPTNAVVPAFVSTIKRFTNKKCGVQLWQRSYHDHLIRDDADYLKIWQYINDNPAKWREDCYYSE